MPGACSSSLRCRMVCVTRSTTSSHHSLSIVYDDDDDDDDDNFIHVSIIK